MALLIFTAASWVVYSEAGTRWAFGQASFVLPGELQVGGLRGSLAGGIQIRDFSYQYDDLQLEGDLLRLRVNVPRLAIGRLQFDQFELAGIELDLPASAASDEPVPEFSGLTLPLALELNDLVVADLVLRQADRDWRIDSFTAAFSADSQDVILERAELRAQSLQVSLVGTIETGALLAHRLSTEWMLRLPSGDEVSGLGILEGDLSRTEVQQLIQSPTEVILKGTLRDLNQSPRWQARVDVQDFEAADWRYSIPELAANLRFDASGDLTRALIDGEGDFTRADTGMVGLQYRLTAHADQRIEIKELKLAARQAPIRISARGEWKPGGEFGYSDLNLNWQHLRWPVNEDAYFLSRSGQGRITGDPADYRFEIDTTNPFDFLPPSQWTGRGKGDLQGVFFDALRIDGLDGEILASGQLGWNEQVSWQADVEARQINPQAMFAEWPGKLNALVQTEGGVIDGRAASDVQITSLEGVLRGYPVSLIGSVDWQQSSTGDRFDLQRFDFHSAGSRLQLSGQVAESVNLDWKLTTPDLAELLPHAQGRLNAEGRVLGSRQQPRIDAQVDGRGVGYKAYRAGSVNGRIKLDAVELQQFEVALDARDVTLGGQTVEQVQVAGNASQLELNAVSGDHQLGLELVGEAEGERWWGKVQRADFTLGALQEWSLEAPVGLDVDPHSVELANSCWIDRHGARLCATLSGRDQLWQSELKLQKLSSALLQPWLPAGLELSASADGSASIEYAGNRLGGIIKLELPPGEIRYLLRDGEREQWSYQSGQIDLVLDPQGVRSQARLTLDNNGVVDATLSLPQADLLAFDPSSQRLQARLTMALDDLGFVGLWLPEAHQVKGRANADLQLAGRLTAPSLEGRISLSDGSFAVPRLGVEVREIELSGQSKDLQRLDYLIKARLGEGLLTIDGVLRTGETALWQTELTVRGKNLQVSRIPEAQIQVSPDLTIRAQPYQVEIEGTLEIPYARIEPRDVSSAVRVSDDVIIVGQEQVASNRWRVVSRVRLVLGDRVHFFGYGFEGRLGGALLIEESTGQPTRASGEITVTDGRYRAYGQRLDVTQGSLVFSGGPLLSPGLDIRAERQVNEVTVGILARGTLDRPQIELFSSPAMGQTDVLSYLILGRPIENASSEEGQAMAKAALALGLTGGDRLARSLRERFGLDEMRVDSNVGGDQASLVLGRYLTPKLYVSYGIGLIEAFNTFIVRYQISERWQLKAESGEYHSADLVFTIDR